MPQVIFDCTQAVQQWTVPPQVTSVTIECWGANSYPNTGADRLGGYAKGNLAVTPGEVLRMYVGGWAGSNSNPQLGGWNGGGDGGGNNTTGSNLHAGGGGGGASDVRQGGTALANRKIVAGGAGGWGVNNGDNAAHGGLGGAGTGAAGDTPFYAGGGGGGTQSAGGAKGTPGNYQGVAGALGNGGNGGTPPSSYWGGGGGGGGGYYGGGGGAFDNTGSGGTGTVGGGGGGSNYVGGVTSTTNQQGVSHSYGSNDGRVVITYNAPPNAPVPTTPASGASVDLTQAIAVGWTFSDPDSGDTQSKADVRWRVGTGAWTTIAAAVTTASTYSFAANTFSAYASQSVEWQVQTYDSLNHSSGWSASSYFTPRTPPDTPTFQAASITSNTAAITFSRPSAGAIAQWQSQVVNDNAGSPGATVLASGTVHNTSGSPTSISGTAPNFAYVNGTKYHLQVRVANPAGVWSAWGDSGALTANVNAPLQPTVALNPVPNTASVQITITNPGSDPNPPAFNRIYRQDMLTGVETLIRTQVPLNSTHTDWTIGFNRVYNYRVEAVTAAGAVTSSM